MEDDNGPLFCGCYLHDIFNSNMDSEAILRPSSNYIQTLQSTSMTPLLRYRLVNRMARWFFERANIIPPETLFSAVSFMDRYFSVKPVEAHNLQLVTAACITLACKYEHKISPYRSDVIDQDTVRKIVKMEEDVLIGLDYQLMAPTLLSFLDFCMHAAVKEINSNSDCKIDKICKKDLSPLVGYLTEASLLEYDLLKYPPSMVAASAVFMAVGFLLVQDGSIKCSYWSEGLVRATRYEASDLCDCVGTLRRVVEDTDFMKKTIAWKKFNHKGNLVVAEKFLVK